MNATYVLRSVFRQGRQPSRLSGWIVAACLALGSVPLACGQQPVQQASRTKALPVAEFSRMVQEFSEQGGYFRSDTFTSNESSYLHVTGKLDELGISGGAYIGVAPEQNFSYIARIRPEIAFIVDIRRQAMIQHLFYKAIFRLAENRAEFLALLFSKPTPPPTEQADDPLVELLNYIKEAPTSRDAFLANLAKLQKTIEKDFQVPLSPADVQSLEYVYRVFWLANLRIGSRFPSGTGGYWYSRMPNLEQLILEKDERGERGNFLAREQDYQFVRKLQEQNRVIPLVGDFAGTKALAAVAKYLRKNGYTVSAFYTSNVEQFLYQNDAFRGFAENVRKLPVTDRSVFIRAALQGRHAAAVPGYRTVTLLQKISVFLDDYDKGLYPDYWSLLNTHYIAGTPTEQIAPSLQPAP
ncbi:MAG: hypothetical protein HY648_12735 [Acidobacteria bacterium]|nr:hypothetical protein [Acidobacteriota bacterium]